VNTIPILKVINRSKGKWTTVYTDAGCPNWDI